MYNLIDNVRIWGKADEETIAQAVRCSQHGNVVQSLLMADNHKGYSQPIGGVVVYDGEISPSGVGYDIGCGNMAVRTELKWDQIRDDISGIMDAIQSNIAFGIGRTNITRIDHELFDDSAWGIYNDVLGKAEAVSLKDLSRNQLGTVGSGNHYVDILVEESTGIVWVANHFGSRGFGHKTASGFLNLANGRCFSDKAPGESMDQPPTLLNVNSLLGSSYLEAMRLAGDYAYAGREYVISQVLGILGTQATLSVHNHHNYAWKENHFGKEVYVVRKGATPLVPGQLSFIGGSMGDISVIVEGVEGQELLDSYGSTVHGAGRVMSRTQAAGKMNWKTRRRAGGSITQDQMDTAVRDYGVELRGAGTDESPFVYRNLKTVLDAHQATMKIQHVLRPVGVCMAGDKEFDPYKD